MNGNKESGSERERERERVGNAKSECKSCRERTETSLVIKVM